MSKINKYYVWFAVLAITYCLLILIIPPDASVLVKYSLSPNQAKLLSLSLALPIIGIWFTAFFGAVKFKQYVHTINESKDGSALATIANGLMYLAFSMPIGSICTNILNYVASTHKSLTPSAVILNNYVNLAIVFAAFYLIYNGSVNLARLLKKNAAHPTSERLMMAVFVIVALAYSFITLHNPARQFPANSTSRAAYYMADFPLVLTIIIPFLFVWFFGIRATYYILLFRKKVKGTLYKQSLVYLALGIGAVIISSMFVRFLVSLTTLLNSLTLKVLLAVVYVLLLVIFTGYILIAIGAKKLKKIEEV